jgi:hypothetical protein
VVEQMAKELGHISQTPAGRGRIRQLVSDRVHNISVRRLLRKTVRRIYSNLYTDRQRDIRLCRAFISGAGRSGTTWLAAMIGSQLPSRILFEPFHSINVSEFRQFNYFHYMRPAESNDALFSYCHKLLSGEIRHPWIDREVNSFFPKYRLIKDIRANLFLKWFSNSFPDVPLLFIIRHPCAVVLSRMEYAWGHESDIEALVGQEALMEDFLRDKLPIFKRAKTAEERHAIIWCVNNLVPLRQFASHESNVVFYERLCSQPREEIRRVFELIKEPKTDLVFRYVNRPSITALPSSAIMTGEDKITRWQTQLSPRQVRNILAVVSAFDLDHLYGDSAMPLCRDPSQVP